MAYDDCASPALIRVKKLKNVQSARISKLIVGTKTYQGENVATGFYDNILSLKTCSDKLVSCNHCDTSRFV